MLSRFSALACVSALAILLPGAQALAQETPTLHGLVPTLEEDRDHENIEFARSVAIHGRTALVSIPDLQRIAIYTQDDRGEWPRTGSILRENVEPGEGDFAYAMAINGRRLAVAAGTVIRLYEQHGSQWQALPIIHLQSKPQGASSVFGVATLAYDGETLAFKQIQFEIDPVTGLNAERNIVVLYRIGRRGEATLVQELRAPLGTGFGGHLAVRGGTLVVGGNSDGTAHVYRNHHGTWRLEQKLSVPLANESGGISAVAIHGRHIVAGVPGEESIPTNGDGSPTSAPISGAVYVFTKSQGRWRQTQRVRPDFMDPQTGGFSSFGGSLAASGKRVAIGAPVPLDNDNGQFGQTYVYRWVGDTLVFDVHLSFTPTTLGMTPRRLIIGTDTFDSHANPVRSAVVLDFGDRDPADNDEAAD